LLGLDLCKEEIMNIQRLVVLAILIFVFVMGCSGSYQELKTKPVNDSVITDKELMDNWSDYNILFRQINGRLVVIAFDPKNDDRKILVENPWRTINDQAIWAEILKANTISDGKFSLNGGYHSPTTTLTTTGVLMIMGPDNQPFGFIILQEERPYVWARMVDENTMRLLWRKPPEGGPAK
jgi:hypothetical protein